MNADSSATIKLFESLVRLHHKRILAFACSLTHDPHQAEDLAQEAFVTAFQKLDEYDSNRDFGNWVRGIVRFKYLEHARRQREIPMSESIINSISTCYHKWDTAAFENKDNLFERLTECIGLLQESARNLISAYYRNNLTCEQIAVQMQVHPPTVRKRLQRIRRDLRVCLQRHSITM